MSSIGNFIRRWGPALLIMAVIFAFSSTPGRDLPRFGVIDFLVKKGGHMLGYGLLGLALWHGLGWNNKQIWLAWCLAVAYAATDEFHQSFVAGRHPSPVDVFLFDGGGAAIFLLAYGWIRKVVLPVHPDPRN